MATVTQKYSFLLGVMPSFFTVGGGTGANYPWEITTAVAMTGSYALRSTNYNVNSSFAWVKATLPRTCQGGYSFYKYGASENNYDLFRFYIDSTKTNEDSGSKKSWMVVSSTMSIAKGVVLQWQYYKDSSQPYDIDRWYIDDVALSWTSNVGKINEATHNATFKKNGLDKILIKSYNGLS